MKPDARKTQIRILSTQAILMLAIVFGPHFQPGFFDFSWRGGPVGWVLFIFEVFGMIVAGMGAFNLGESLHPGPQPPERSSLKTNGIYRFIRNPIYTGGILMALPWSLHQHSWVSLAATILLGVLFWKKTRMEEAYLIEKFGNEYLIYARKVGRFVPGVGLLSSPQVQFIILLLLFTAGHSVKRAQADDPYYSTVDVENGEGKGKIFKFENPVACELALTKLKKAPRALPQVVVIDLNCVAHLAE